MGIPPSRTRLRPTWINSIQLWAHGRYRRAGQAQPTPPPGGPGEPATDSTWFYGRWLPAELGLPAAWEPPPSFNGTALCEKVPCLARFAVVLNMPTVGVGEPHTRRAWGGRVWGGRGWGWGTIKRQLEI